MDPCMFCLAMVLPDDMNDHARWHVVNNLHRFDCIRFHVAYDPEPWECSCGLAELARMT